MPEAEKTIDLTPLQDSYEIVGELRRGDDTLRYTARRKADNADVEITIVRVPADDPNHGLAHFASDITLLKSRSHPHVVPVSDGKWLASDTFAVVRDRVVGTPLGELTSRGEALTRPRVAAILQDVLGVLKWARANGVVHRGVNPHTLWIQRGTDRPMVSFALMPISAHGIPDAADDARTIGTLAHDMLAAPAAPLGDDEAPTITPLATRVIDETAAMMAYKTGDPEPDVYAYIATVAMGDALREGELEMAVMQAELMEANRVIRQQWEDERASVERKAADEAVRCANENAAIKKQMAREREQLDADRVALDVRRAEVEQELAAVAEARALADQRIDDLESERAAVDQLRSEVEQRLAEERQMMADLLAAQRDGGVAEPSERAVPVPVAIEPVVRARHRGRVAMAGAVVLVLAALLVLARHENARRIARANAIVPESLYTHRRAAGSLPAQDPDYLTRSAGGLVSTPAPVVAPKPVRRDTVPPPDTTSPPDTTDLGRF